ncbi:MAG: DUF4384 domain-containing protein [Elusimicrobia bacterium]|nr:DUF4384 domain-containing protein [Elusimicrobiota bacterium]
MRPGIAVVALAAFLGACHERREASREDLTPKAARRAWAEALEENKEPVKAAVLGPDSRGCTWIASEGSIAAGEDQTPHQLRAQAVDAARRSAMQDFLGVSVRARTMDFQQEGLRDQKQVIESMLLTTRQGRIMDEQVLRDGYEDAPGCPRCRYRAAIKTCLLPTPGYADKDFSLDLGLSRDILFDGDEVTLSVTATRDCYLYVYDLWLDWQKTSLIAPNPQIPEIRLKAGQTWEYPDAAARRAGVKALAAQLPEGYDVSVETVRVVASRQPLPAKVTDPAQGFLAVLGRLNAQKIDWAEDAQAFTIYKAKR